MTLRELLADRSLGLLARAGLAHLDRQIRWVHSTELLDPSAYLSGGELIHTVALWRREPVDSETFTLALASSGVSGVALGVGPEPMLVETCPPDLIEACERHGLPLLEVPNTTRFVAVSEAVIEAIMHERRQTLEGSLAREQELTRASVGDGILGVLEVLSTELGCDCWVIGSGATVLAGTRDGIDPATALLLVLAARKAHRQPTTVHDVLNYRVIVAPIRAAPPSESPALGYLACAPRDGAMADSAQQAIAQTAEFLALECAHLRAVRASDRRFAAHVLALVEEGRVADAEVAARLEGFGIDPARPLVAVAVAAAEQPGSADVVLDVLDHVSAALGGPSVTASGEADALAVLACGGGEEEVQASLRAAGERMIDALAALRVAMGVSGVVPGVAGLRRALVEARQARRFAELRRGGPPIATNREIGSHALLLALNAEDVRTAFKASLLDSLLGYDAAHRSDLVHTLDIFLATCGAWQRTAERLHIHVNTLRYRLRRIEQLTGRDLGSMDDRVDFHLALRIHASDANRS
jgi:sugar diacid utilization regulator